VFYFLVAAFLHFVSPKRCTLRGCYRWFNINFDLNYLLTSIYLLYDSWLHQKSDQELWKATNSAGGDCCQSLSTGAGHCLIWTKSNNTATCVVVIEIKHISIYSPATKHNSLQTCHSNRKFHPKPQYGISGATSPIHGQLWNWRQGQGDQLHQQEVRQSNRKGLDWNCHQDHPLPSISPELGRRGNAAWPKEHRASGMSLPNMPEVEWVINHLNPMPIAQDIASTKIRRTRSKKGHFRAGARGSRVLCLMSQACRTHSQTQWG